MSSIVIITSHMAGRINATCELARRLRAAGHDVTLASPVDIGERVTAQGMDYVYIGPAETTERSHADKPGPVRRVVAFLGRLRTLRTVQERRQAAVDALDLETLEQRLCRFRADLYLIDIELPVEIMVARSMGANVAVWTTMLSLWKRPGLPPLHTDIVPGRGWRGSRLGIEWAWLRFRLWKWLRYQRQRVTRVGTDQYSVLRGVAARTNYPIREATARYHWLIPFVYRDLPTIMVNALEFELPHRPDAVCIYVGPLLNPARRVADADAAQVAISEELEAVYERRRSGDTTALIYCSFGSWHEGDDGAFIRRVTEAVGRRPDWELVVGLGGRLGPDGFGELPDNVRVLPWAPQLEVLEHADLAIHHAGISSINESIVSGVPMIVYPFDYGDTPGAAARVVFHGLGLRGDRTADDVDAVFAKIEQVLTDPEFHSNTTRMRVRYAECQAANAAVVAVERLLSSED